MRMAARFQGPPGSANGGVACGLLATHLDAPGGSAVEVTLRQPPPLDVDLRVDGGNLYAGDVLIATAVPAALALAPVGPVDVATARAAAASYAGLVDHPFPGCFVCGTGRSDGMGLTPGLVAAETAAAVWVPADADPVMVWAALDCPGGWSADVPGRPMVLGRMTAQLDALPTPGEEHVVVGWVLGREGRKTRTGTALYDGAGALLALATAVWFTVDPATAGLPS